MARDILKTLKNEHEALRKMFGDLNDTSDRAVKKRGDLLSRIEESLVPHAKWEEDVFYPAFKDRADRQGLQSVAEAYSEHHAVENSVIPEVHQADAGSPEFAGRAKVFGEFVDHHAREEEKTMFKMARDMFTIEELAQMDEHYEAWKASPGAREAVMAERAKVAPGSTRNTRQ